MASHPATPPPPDTATVPGGNLAAPAVVGAAPPTGRWRRLDHGRVVAGVAAGLGWRLGVDPVLVRIAFAVLAFAGGAGLVLYGVLWAAVPSASATPPPRRRATGQQGVALALIVLGILLLLRAFGVWFGDQLMGPMVLLAAGSAVLWTRADDDERAAWSHLAGVGASNGTSSATGRGSGSGAGTRGGAALRRAAAAPTSPLRIVGGTALVALAILGALLTTGSLAGAQDLLVVLIVALVGSGLLFGPWLWRLVDELAGERRERVRQAERAELAAHLHDSVLQTLALIQRSNDDPKRMVTLARRQERELRTWLYGTGGTSGSMTLTEAVHGVTEEVEAVHGATIEVVVVGDVPLDEHVWALLAAIREAAVNAATHSGDDHIDVYVEVAGEEVLAYVRDRGRGFDLASIPPDRAGIRGSIVDRIERHDGQATVHTTPGEGTEVELSVPRPAGPTTGWATGTTTHPDAPVPTPTPAPPPTTGRSPA